MRGNDMARDSFPSDPRHHQDLLRQDRESRTINRFRVQRGQETLEIPSPDGRGQRSLKQEREDSPRAHVLRDRTYLLRDSELHTMSDLGTFRVVAAADLAR